MSTSSPIVTASPICRISAIVARQRAGRSRDLLFAAAIAIGLALSIGALHDAFAHATAAAHLAARG